MKTLSLIVFLTSASVCAAGEGALKSGPQPGQWLPGPFFTLHINGPWQGKVEQAPTYSMPMRPPSAFVFARATSGPIVSLIKTLDADASKTKDIASIVYFADEKELEGLARRLKDLAEKEKIESALLSIWRKPKSPPAWNISDDAEVTVVMFNNERKVLANFAYRKDKLDEKAIDAIMTALAKTRAPKIETPIGAPSDADFKKQIERLQAKDKAERLDAARWIARHTTAKSAALAIPALERRVRTDPDADVRYSAVESLVSIATLLRKPCPLAVVEAMLDKDDRVSQAADLLASSFKQFESGSLDVLLRYAQTAQGKSAGAVLHLARLAPKDKRVIAAIESALKEKSFGVRHNAHVAMFHATDNLHEFLVYFIRLRDNPDALLGDIDKTTDEGKRERATCNLVQLGGAVLKVEWSEKRPDDYAAALLKLLDEPSPILRRGAAQDIGAAAARIDTNSDYMKHLLKFIEGDKSKDAKKPADANAPPQKSKVALKLEKLGVEARLIKMRDADPDATVRAAVRAALARWALVFKK